MVGFWISTQLTLGGCNNSLEHIEMKRTTSDLIKLGWNMPQKYRPPVPQDDVYFESNLCSWEWFWNPNNRIEIDEATVESPPAYA